MRLDATKMRRIAAAATAASRRTRDVRPTSLAPSPSDNSQCTDPMHLKQTNLFPVPMFILIIDNESLHRMVVTSLISASEQHEAVEAAH